MKGALSEEDWERIEKFSRSPAYDRRLDMLVPDEDEDSKDDE